MPAAPLPRALPPLIPPPGQPALLFPAEKRTTGDSRTPLPSQRVPAGAACMPPPEPGVLMPISFSPFNKRENSKPPLGSVVLPRVLGPAASQLCVEGAPAEPRALATRSHPPPHPLLLPVAVFATTTCSGVFRSLGAFPMNLASGLCSQKPVCLPTPLLARTEPGLPVRS